MGGVNNALQHLPRLKGEVFVILIHMRDHVIFIDWYKTLNEDRFWKGWSLPNSIDFLKYQTIQQKLVIEQPELLRSWMRGQKTINDICDFLSICLKTDSAEIKNELLAGCSKMLIPNQLLSKIDNLRKTNYIVLATDNMDCFLQTMKKNRISEHFDCVLNSSELGFLKEENNGDFFLNYLRSVNIPITHAILIDDSQLGCERFIQLGGLAHQTLGPKHTEILLDSYCNS